MNPVTLLTEWSQLLFGALARAGVHDVVLSPGSRSTPFTWAALSSGLRCHTVIDERSAGFVALGHARVTGRPSVLVCTSGSAGANYYPAVVEADASGTPLIVLTADRPTELQGCRAPQTIDQVKLFGGAVRGFFDLGNPEVAALSSLPRLAAQAVLAAQFPAPGPVHLNARARKPLEPLPDGTGATLQSGPGESGYWMTPLPEAPQLQPHPAAVKRLAEALRRAERPLLVAGPRAAWWPDLSAVIRQLSGHLVLPVFAEAPSQLRWGAELPFACDALGTLLGSEHFAARFAPDLIVELGTPLTSSAWERFVARSDAERYVLAALPWPDPAQRAHRIVLGEPLATLEAVWATLGDAPPHASVLASRQAFAAGLQRDAARVWTCVSAELEVPAGHPTDGGDASEGAMVQAALAAVPHGAWVVLGNSLPLREVDTFCPARDLGCRVVTQRGTNGIDGLVSGAAGVARASASPTLLLVGDVSLLHDIGGLLVAREAREPLVIVVLNNDGGRIFEQLPVHELTRHSEPLAHAWTTPHGLDLTRAGPLFGIPAERLTSARELARSIRAAFERRGCTLLEAVVAPHGAREQAARLRQRVAAALEASDGAP